jgi:hypothetical protein
MYYLLGGKIVYVCLAFSRYVQFYNRFLNLLFFSYSEKFLQKCISYIHIFLVYVGGRFIQYTLCKINQFSATGALSVDFYNANQRLRQLCYSNFI